MRGSELSQKEIEEYRQLFSLFDTENKGVITINNIQQVMSTLGQNLTNTKLKDMISDIDGNGTGRVDFNEFVQKLAYSQVSLDPKTELKEAFRVFDPNMTGFVTAESVFKGMKNLRMDITKEEAEKMIALADKKGNGVVSFDEFCAVINPTK
eukprot:c8233_g1_i1.p1 GENE.c8233_g1_i1~~c8233_g1_i1.p1  ORF type:complete len:152 (+),score=58.79 c8233_g1_i1:51-506(+)